MTNSFVDNTGEADYEGKLRQIAKQLEDWTGPIVLISHVDPDGDALGSTLSLKRALDAMGKATGLVMEVPSYLKFLVNEGEISEPLEQLPENCLLAVLDVEIGPRATGAPLEGAAFTINIDHHGSNRRLGDLSCVQPSQAANTQIIKDLIDLLPIEWTAEIATPCLTGIITDTGNFRYSNTNGAVLQDAAELMEKGVDYTFLADRLQWRSQTYFQLLGKVMSTVEFPFDGLAAIAYITTEMENEVPKADDDSNDYVGLIRYAEGIKLAIFLKGREDHTKVSVRSRDGISAQAICLALGGGGHVAAAGAKLPLLLEEAKVRVLEEVKKELERHNLLA